MRFLCYNQRIYRHSRRHWQTLLTLALSLGVGHQAHAQLLTAPEEPSSIEQVKEFVSARIFGDEQDGPIIQELNNAMCGGTSAQESLNINANSLGKIPDVRNVPGRHGDPLGAILSGIAQRFDDGGPLDDGYEFPDNTTGHTTPCLPNMPKTVKRRTTWGTEIDVPYPQIRDPACKYYGDTTEQYMTPSSCERSCSYMNREEFGYWDCRSRVVWFLGVWICLDGGPGVTEEAIGLTRRYVCSDNWADEPSSRNCLACQGADCRCPGPGCRTAANNQPYRSFDRQYVAESRREKVDDVPTDKLATQEPPKDDCSAEQDELDTARTRLGGADDELQRLLDELTPMRQEHVQKRMRIALLQNMINEGWENVERMERDVREFERIRDNEPDSYKPDEPLTTEERVEELNAIIDNLYARIDQLRMLIERWEEEKEQLTLEAEALRERIGEKMAELVRLEDAVSDALKELDEADRNLRDCEQGKAVRIPAACYGFYREFDTKKQVTENRDRRCTLGFPLDPEELKESQSGTGEIFTPVADMPFTPRNPDFDENADLWDPNLGGAMSLLSDTPFQEKANEDLHRVLLELEDVASINVSTPRTDAEPYVKNGLLRAFDDTSGASTRSTLDTKDARTFTKWWQQLQTDVTRLLTPPRVRLRLPDTGALVPNVSLLGEDATVRRDAGNRSIEVEIRADDDMLGKVAAFLKSSLLLQLQEEPIPVVVPLGSPGEFRAVRDRWCQWVLQKHYAESDDPAAVDCRDVASEDVLALMDRLEEYAVQIEQVRLLRSELSKNIGTILSRQQVVVSTVSEWVTQNLEAYHAFLRNRRDRGRLLEVWQLAEREATRFQDTINMPWCRNDRFTLPIYSLLDPWLEQAAAGNRSGERRGLSGGTPTCTQRVPGLPVVCPPTSDHDVVLDFSTLIVEPGSISFPVLKPVQIRLNLPVPPAQGEPDAAEIALPSLPPVPTLQPSDIAQLPDVLAREPLPQIMVEPEQIPLNLAWSAIMRSRTILLQMIMSYDKFWKSLEPAPDDLTVSCQDPDDPDKQCPLEGKDLELRCENWDASPCVHTEVDLIERITRIMARPAVLLREDLESQGIGRLLSTYCDPTDEACLQLLREEQLPKDGWQLVPPTGTQNRQPAIQAIRDRLRQLTVAESGSIVRLPTTNGPDRPIPYGATPEQILPIFTVPDPIILTPRSSSSSSSTPIP